MIRLPGSKRAFIKISDDLQYGTLNFIVPDGQSKCFQGKQAGPQADFQLNDWTAIYKLIRNNSIGFSEAYRDGLWQTNDLMALLELAIKNQQHLDHFFYGITYCRIFLRED